MVGNAVGKSFFTTFVTEIERKIGTMKKDILLTSLLALSASTMAQELEVTAFRHVGPLPLQRPLLMDSTGVDGQRFSEADLLKTPLRLESVRDGHLFSDAVLAKDGDGRPALHLAAFRMTNTAFTKATIAVKGLSHYELYLDRKAVRSGEAVELQPAMHEVVVKALTTVASTDSLHVTVTPTVDGALVLNTAETRRRPYTLDDVLHARRYSDVSLSPNGRWMIVSTSQTQPDGDVVRQTEVREVATGRVVDRRQGVQWMTRSNQYFYTRPDAGRRTLVSVDPQTSAETVLARDLPEGSFVMAPTEDCLLFTLMDEGPKERPDVYEVIHPDDRQPGWRTRSHLATYDLRTGIMQPLTFGHSSTYLLDCSQDGRYA